MFLMYDGRVFVSGSNNEGQLGNGGGPTSDPVMLTEFHAQGIKFQQVAACSNLSAALTTKGEVYVWGEGFTAYPGLVEGIKGVSQIGLGQKSIAALNSSGQLMTWGDNASGQLGHGDFDIRAFPQQVAEIKRRHIEYMAIGSNFSIALGRRRVDLKEVRHHSPSPLRARSIDKGERPKRQVEKR